jgi:L-fuconolactonase
MSVIDSHHHFWWTAKHSYHWPPQAGDRMNRDFTPEDLRSELEACGIDGSVLVQVLQLKETQEFLDVSRQWDFVRGVVGWVPLAEPKATAAALEDLPGRGRLVGIRYLISNEADPAWLLQVPVAESLARIAAAGLAFDAIPINTAQFESVLQVARRFPDLRIVINHLGRPPIPEQGWEPWASQIAQAARLDNVSMKLSVGLDIIMQWRWSNDTLRRYVDHALQAFGPARLMAGSNWPVILLGGSYREVWQGITGLIAGLSAAERAAILGGTAERIYRLTPAGRDDPDHAKPKV